MTASGMTTQPSTARLACDEILRIARQDAEPVYRDLSLYRISLILESDGWHVDYDLPQYAMAGGGPHYIINPEDGSIVSKRYEQ